MKLIKKQISGITIFYRNNIDLSLNTTKRYSINLWSEGTQKQGAYVKTLYFDDTLEKWRLRDCDCENKNKSLDFSVVIEENTLKSLETLKAYGIDNGGIAIFNEIYCEINEIGGGDNSSKLYHHSIIIMDMRSVEYLYFELWTSNDEVLDVEKILNCPYLVEGDFKLSLNALYFNATEPTFKPALISSYGNGFNVTVDFDDTKQWDKNSLAMRQDIVKRLW